MATAKTILKDVDKQRLAEVLQVIESLHMKFPNAEIHKKLNEDPGNISSYLNGKKPMSDNFYTSFMEAFRPKKPSKIVIKDADLGKEISKLIEITIKQQAAINLLMKAFENVSAKAVQKEYERLYDEYVNQLQSALP